MKPQKNLIVAEIRSKLEQTLEPQLVEIMDVSYKHRGHAGARPEGETHFEIRIVSEQFRGRSRLEQQRLVYTALAELMNNPIHALALQCEVPG